MNKRISVIGVGRLGNAFALLAEQAGYGVIGVDKREEYVEELNAKTFRTPEPQIEYLLRRSRNFKATTNVKEAIEWSDLLFVFVPTPSKEDGEYNHEHIEEVVTDLIAYRGNIAEKKLIICSTVTPTFSAWIPSALLSRIKQIPSKPNPYFKYALPIRLSEPIVFRIFFTLSCSPDFIAISPIRLA